MDEWTLEREMIFLLRCTDAVLIYLSLSSFLLLFFLFHHSEGWDDSVPQRREISVRHGRVSGNSAEDVGNEGGSSCRRSCKVSLIIEWFSLIPPSEYFGLSFCCDSFPTIHPFIHSSIG